MDTQLRVLIIEDSDRDVSLEVRALKAAGYQVTYTVAETAAEMKAALTEQSFDIVISDNDLPQFNAPGALAVLNQSSLDIPFIIVSGTIGEEAAVALMKAGANDYVVKDRLSRLVPAIQKELKEAELRRENRRLEEARRTERIMLARTEGIAHIGSWEWDIATDTVTWSDELFRIFQRDPQEGAPSFAEHPAFYHPDDMARLQKAVEAAVTNGTHYELELRAIRKDGMTRFCVASGVTKIASGGRAICLFGSLQDITERKKVEEELLRTNTLLNSIIENIPNMLFLKDAKELRFVRFNRAGEDLLGYPREVMLGKNDYDLFPKDQADFFIEKDRVVLQRKEVIDIPEESLQTRNKGERILHTMKVPILNEEGKSAYLLGISEDITERKQTELARQYEYKRAQRYLDTVETIIVALDTEGRITTINRKGCQLIERREDELIGQSWFSTCLPQPDGMKNVYPEFLKLVADELESSEYFENSILTFSGELRHIAWHNALLRDEQGWITGILSSGEDITARKQAEEKLIQTLDSLRKAVDATIQVIVSAVEVRDPYTSGHQLRSANLARAIATEMGLSPEKIEGIWTAASIHDVGKLSIPAEILSKPTKLTPIEFLLIKEHANRGYEILKGVESSWPLAEIIYQHHERMDGSGYPRSLKGEEILIEARILAVADVVEAMASHRPYRPGLGIDAALKEIEENKGILYDETVVDACLRLFREEGYQLEDTNS